MKAESRTSIKSKNTQETAGVTEDSADTVEGDLMGSKALVKTPRQAVQLESKSNQNSLPPKWTYRKDENLTGIHSLCRTQGKGRTSVRPYSKLWTQKRRQSTRNLGQLPGRIVSWPN